MIKISIKRMISIALAVLFVLGLSLLSFASLKERGGDFTSAALLEQEELQLKWDTKARLERYRTGDYGADIHDRVYKEHIRDQDPHRLLGTESTTRYGAATKVIDGAALEKNSDTQKSVAQYFTKWFKNNIRVIYIEKLNSTGMVAVEADMTGMPMKNLVFYSYDYHSNVYDLIPNVDYSIDKTGKISFNTNIGSYIIVSDGELVKK